MPHSQALPVIATLLGSLALAGCSSAPTGTTAASMIPAPASGAAWRVVGQGGNTNVQGAAPAGAVSIGPDGTIRAQIPASAEAQQAQGALAPGSFGAIQIRNAP